MTKCPFCELENIKLIGKVFEFEEWICFECGEKWVTF
jgi:transposase-like protein